MKTEIALICLILTVQIVVTFVFGPLFANAAFSPLLSLILKNISPLIELEKIRTRRMHRIWIIQMLVDIYFRAVV